MDWQSINFDWNRARAFYVAAKEGSFSAAAKALGVAQPTLGRQVSALEDEVGVALFEKVGKNLELTPAGVELLEYVKNMAEAANSFSMVASGKTKELEGKVSISASESFAVHLLPKILVKINKKWPKIQLEIISTNESTDLRKREADIAFRNYRPKHPDLLARKINEAKYHLYASPKYLKTLKPIKKVSDLNEAKFIGFLENDAVIKELNSYGMNLNQENFPYICSGHLNHWELVKDGAGIGFMAEIIGSQEKKVVPILPDLMEGMKYDNWLVAHRDLKNSLRIRVVYDFLYDELVKLYS